MAELVSVNVGMPRPVDTANGPVVTGIFKRPTRGSVRVRKHNLEGDGQADLSVHGGENKAVYGYPAEHYRTWAAELRRDDLEWGQFGENLTTKGLLEEEVVIGDVLKIGTSILQVSQPRSPCFKLGIRMGDPKFVKTFLQSGRPGFYFRVLEEGRLQSGDEIKRLERGETGVTIFELWDLTFGAASNPDRLRLAQSIPTLGPEWLRRGT